MSSPLLALLTARSIDLHGDEATAVAICASADCSAPVLAVGTWSNAILLYRLDDSRQPLGGTIITKHETSHASSLLLIPSASEIQLLAGLGDGSLVTYSLPGDTWTDSSVSKKTSSLGTLPLMLHPIGGACDNGVALGLSDRASILFQSSGRIEFSSANLQDVTAAAGVAVPGIGPCIAISTPTVLSLTKVNGLKKLQIATLDLGERNVSIVRYLPHSKAIACGATERRMDEQSGDLWQQSYMELRDPVSLQCEHFIIRLLPDKRETDETQCSSRLCCKSARK